MAAAAAKAPSIAHQLHTEIEAAKALKLQLGDILGDDTEAQADAVEGETQLHELMESALKRVAEVDMLLSGLAMAADNLASRAGRLKKQRDNLRTALLVAMEVAEKPRLETAVGTIVVKSTARQLDILDEAMIPSRFWVRAEPHLDKQAIKDALKSGEVVPGAVLDNGGATVQLTFR